MLSSPVVARAVRWGLVAWSAIGVAILGYLVFRYVLHPIRIIFPPLVVALIIVYLLNPLVSRLERRGLARLWGTLLVYLVFLTAVGFALAALIPLVSRQVGTFVDSAPELLDQAKVWIAETGQRLGFDVSPNELFSTQGREAAFDFLGRLTSFTAGVLHVGLIVVLGPIIAFYLTVDLPKIRRAGQAMIPGRRREEVKAVAARLSAAVGGFVRGQLLVALFVGLASMLVLYVVGLPYWAVVGLLTGLFNLIPLIGPFIGAALAVLIAFAVDRPAAGFLLHPDPGLPLALASVIGLLIVQQVDNHIMSPNIVARTVKLHPVTVMLSLLAGGTLLGLWGMLLAVPVVASAKILMLHAWDTRSSWPPDAPLTVAEAEVERTHDEVSGDVPVRPSVGATAPSDQPPALVREGMTSRWWWRWRARLPWRRRDEEPAATEDLASLGGASSRRGDGDRTSESQQPAGTPSP
jgi:predicted PurR-regulated permease PerM